jgi:hypothetical protein
MAMNKAEVDPPPTDIRRLFSAFGITFLIVHRVLSTFFIPSSSSSSINRRLTLFNNNDASLSSSLDGKQQQKKRRTPRRRALKYYLTNFGVSQLYEGNDEERAAMDDVTSRMEHYMTRWITKFDHDENIKERCINTHDKCVFWASADECTMNPGFMNVECALACNTCDKLLVEKELPPPPPPLEEEEVLMSNDEL